MQEAVEPLQPLGARGPAHGLLHRSHGVAVGGVEVEQLAVLGGDRDLARDLRPVQDSLTLVLAQLTEGNVHAHPQCLGDVPHPRDAEDAPRAHRALAQGQALVGDQAVLVDLADLAGAVALRTGAGGVEGEALRPRAHEADRAHGTGQWLLQGHERRRLAAVAVRAQVTPQAGVGQAQRVENL